jgi:hypothetical protein
MPQPLNFDFYNSIIEVPAPDTSLDMQYLIDQIRDVEDELSPGMAYNKIADASGKDDLGGGIYTAITVRLLDNWRIRFEARSGPDTVQCFIVGGNLVGGPGGNPIAPSAYTQVVQQSSASGVIATPTTSTENINLRYLIGSLSSRQRALGSMFYWDPVAGSDSNNGLTPQTAVATFAKAHDLCTNGANDVIFAISSDSSGTTTTSENLVITKKNVKLRGPGAIFKIIPSSITNDAIVINADNAEISGFYISTPSGSSKNGITVNANNAFIQDCWVYQAGGNGIDISSSSLSVITLSVIEKSAGNGINIGSGGFQNTVSKCIIFDNVNGVNFSGTGLEDNIMENNIIYKHTQYGINIDTGVLRTIIRGGHTFAKNDLGSVHDLGTDTYIETQAGGASATEIADAVWDEVLTSHTVAGSSAALVKDARVKATLAALK